MAQSNFDVLWKWGGRNLGGIATSDDRIVGAKSPLWILAWLPSMVHAYYLQLDLRSSSFSSPLFLPMLLKHPLWSSFVCETVPQSLGSRVRHPSA